MRLEARDYATLLDSIGAIVWEADPETLRFRFVSKQAERLLGHPLEAWLTEGFWLDHVHAEDRERAEAFCRASIREAKAHEFEYRMLAADGSVVWVRDIVTVVCEGGRPTSLRGVMVDIGAHRRASEELRLTGQRLATVVRNAPLVLFGLDRDGVVTLCEGRGMLAAGIDPNEILGVSYADVFPEAPHIRRNLGRCLAGEEFTDLVTFRGRVFETRYMPLRAPSGSVDGMIGVGMDVTERKKAEGEREALEAQLRQSQKLESLGLLAGGIAHDFNNILMTILGNSDIALRELEEGSASRARVERLRVAARRAADLTGQLLAYTGQRPLAPRALDLSSFVSGMLDLLQMSISKRASLRLELGDALPPIEAEPAQLSQVVLNLVTNASEALEGESGEIVVRTGTEELQGDVRRGLTLGQDLPDGRYVVLEVHDSGAGMSRETSLRIFEPFFSTKFAGRGLGLAVVLGIVRGHRGALDVTSQPARGTRFRALFPCVAGPVEVARHPQAEAAPRQPWRGHGLVLVIDDEPDVREIAAAMLRQLGFRSLAFGKGSEAVASFRRTPERFAAVLLDLTMPERSGEEILQELRALRPDLPVVLMTGFTEEYAASRLARSELAAFLHKPFETEALGAALRSVVARVSSAT